MTEQIGSTKDRILAFLAANADPDGRVALDVPALSRGIGVRDKDVVHQLYRLRRFKRLTFKESNERQGTHRPITDIRLLQPYDDSPVGDGNHYDRAIESLSVEAVKPFVRAVGDLGPAVLTRDLQRALSLSAPAIRVRTQRALREGWVELDPKSGPRKFMLTITEEGRGMLGLGAIGFRTENSVPVLEQEPADLVPPTTVNSTFGSSASSAIGEGSLTPGGNVIGPKAWTLIKALNHFDDFTGTVLDVVDEAVAAATDKYDDPRYRMASIRLDNFPFLLEVREKVRRRIVAQQAAAMLEEAGMIDIAAMALEAAGKATELDAEIVRLLEAIETSK